MKVRSTILVVLLFAALSDAVAQDQSRAPEPYGEHTFRQLVTTQLTRSLDSPLDMVRAQTLKNAVVFGTLYRDKADLSQAVPKIAQLAEADDNLQNRRLAIAALKAIGSARATRHLTRLDEMHEDEYRDLVAGIISEYYEQHRENVF